MNWLDPRRFFVQLRGLALFAALCGAVRADPPKGSQWNPVEAFSDEFEGSALDGKKWTTCLLNKWKGIPPGFQTPNNVSVSGGRLRIAVKAESVPEMSGEYRDFTCGVVRTNRIIRYGYFEVRAKPNRSRASSTFWFYNDTPEWWTEIDVFEISGAHPTYRRSVHTDAHVMRAPGLEKEIRGPQSHQAAADLADDFHVYGLEWDREWLKWYFDGQLIRKMENKHWTQALHLVLDCETLGSWFGLPEKSDLPAVYEVDYARAWQHGKP